MSKPIEITRFDLSAAELRELAARTQDGAVVRRLLAIALVLEGYPREAAAQLNGMDRQTLRDWVLRYNAEGVAGLRSRCSPGRPAALNEAQMEELRTMVLEGPDIERNKVVRWRCADLQEEIASRWSVSVAERTVGKLLRRLRMTRLQPRPCHPKKDAAAQEAFKKRARVAGPPVALETGCAILTSRGAAEKFLVDLTPLRNVVHGLLRTCEW
jgi:transposase